MNKLIIGLSVLIVVAFGWLAFQSSTVSYVATVDDEITQLEEELAQIEVDIEAGQLTPAEASIARVTIAARLDRINDAVTMSESSELSEKQKAVLVDGLNRLKSILIKYQDTLVQVENTATDKKTLTSKNGKSRSSLSVVLDETIEAVEENVIEVVDEYTPEESEMTEDEVSEEEMTEETTQDETPGEEEQSPVAEEEMTEEAEQAETTEEETSTSEEATIEAGAGAEIEAGTETEVNP
jgi:hypothetical protein